MKRFFLFVNLVTGSLALAGCVEKDSATGNPIENRVYSVNEFLAQPALRKKIFELCANNPGQTESSPNCVNVISAERIASSGTTIPRIRP